MCKTHERKDCVTLLQELEDLEALKVYDEAKSSGDEVIPLDQALAEIEARR